MANIQQAAQWLKEGHQVQRVSLAGRMWLTPYYPLRGFYQAVCADGGDHVLDCSDLLAEDWEIIL